MAAPPRCSARTRPWSGRGERSDDAGSDARRQERNCSGLRIAERDGLVTLIELVLLAGAQQLKLLRMTYMEST